MTLKPWRLAAVAAAMLVATAVMPSHAQVEAAKAAAIKPFKAHVPDGVLDDLRRRLFMSSAAKTTLETAPRRGRRVWAAWQTGARTEQDGACVSAWL